MDAARGHYITKDMMSPAPDESKGLKTKALSDGNINGCITAEVQLFIDSQDMYDRTHHIDLLESTSFSCFN